MPANAEAARTLAGELLKWGGALDTLAQCDGLVHKRRKVLTDAAALLVELADENASLKQRIARGDEP